MSWTRSSCMTSKNEWRIGKNYHIMEQVFSRFLWSILTKNQFYEFFFVWSLCSVRLKHRIYFYRLVVCQTTVTLPLQFSTNQNVVFMVFPPKKRHNGFLCAHVLALKRPVISQWDSAFADDLKISNSLFY